MLVVCCWQVCAYSSLSTQPGCTGQTLLHCSRCGRDLADDDLCQLTSARSLPHQNDHIALPRAVLLLRTRLSRGLWNTLTIAGVNRREKENLFAKKLGTCESEIFVRIESRIESAATIRIRIESRIESCSRLGVHLFIHYA